jgi:hypothetical protein
VMEPASEAAVAVPDAWTLPHALSVIAVARQRMLSRRGGLPLEDASCVVFDDGVPFYKCRLCAVRVSLASERGALAEHFMSWKHLRNSPFRAGLGGAVGPVTVGAKGGRGRSRPQPPSPGPGLGGSHCNVAPPAPLGAPAAPAPSAPGVPAAVGRTVAASAGTDGTRADTGADEAGPGGGSSAGGGLSGSPTAAPTDDTDTRVAACVRTATQSAFLHDLSITDANEQRWWRWHAEDCVECTMCNKRIFGGGQHRSSLAARVREHRGTADHGQQYQLRKGQSMLRFPVVSPQP